jgi:peptidyl-tRNA hydrolase, PTH1 family
LRLFGRRRRDGEAGGEPGVSASADRLLVIGLGNPERRYAETRHNIGFEIAAELLRRWELPRAKERFRGRITEGRAGAGGPRVAVLLPQTFMNESGTAAGPARGALKVPLEMVVVLHDEIDLPFGEVRSKLGGGVAGHKGLRSVAQGLGGRDFWRVRAGIGRPDTTDPEIVSDYVLSRFDESDEEVQDLVGRAADEAERVVRQVAGAGDEVASRDAEPGAPVAPETGSSGGGAEEPSEQ